MHTYHITSKSLPFYVILIIRHAHTPAFCPYKERKLHLNFKECVVIHSKPWELYGQEIIYQSRDFFFSFYCIMLASIRSYSYLLLRDSLSVVSEILTLRSGSSAKVSFTNSSIYTRTTFIQHSRRKERDSHTYISSTYFCFRIRFELLACSRCLLILSGALASITTLVTTSHRPHLISSPSIPKSPLLRQKSAKARWNKMIQSHANNPALAEKIRQLSLPLAPLVSLPTGDIHPSFPKNLLHFWLLTTEELDDMAHFYHQRTPGPWTLHYPRPVRWERDATIGMYFSLISCIVSLWDVRGKGGEGKE